MVSDTGQQADLFEGLPSDAVRDASAPPDGTAFSGSTPTNAGADTVSQVLLQTKFEAQCKAAQESAERQAAYVEQQRVAQREAADRRIAVDAAARADAAESIRVAQQREAEHRAKAEADAAEVNAFTDTPGDQTQVASENFPGFAARFRQDLGDRWEKMSENADLADYGVSDWKGQSLETVFSRIDVRLRNRIRGDYMDRCYVFGQINDVDFAMTRDHVALPCEDGADLATWQNRHGFKSSCKLR